MFAKQITPENKPLDSILKSSNLNFKEIPFILESDMPQSLKGIEYASKHMIFIKCKFFLHMKTLKKKIRRSISAEVGETKKVTLSHSTYQEKSPMVVVKNTNQELFFIFIISESFFDFIINEFEIEKFSIEYEDVSPGYALGV